MVWLSLDGYVVSTAGGLCLVWYRPTAGRPSESAIEMVRFFTSVLLFYFFKFLCAFATLCHSSVLLIPF